MVDDKIYSWLPADERLNPFYKGVVDFVDRHIDISKVKKYKYAKEILDPCVGYVKLNSWEIAIIDTPLFQRLRKITQLGLAYQVYPTLRYSRLEHTIGVIGRLNQSLQKLKEKHQLIDKDENEKIRIDDVLIKYETQVRLAALFHDVGHCIFSHLSESVLYDLQGVESSNEFYPSVKEIVEIFNHNFASEDTNLSIAEIFSITILGVKKVGQVLIEGNIDIYTTKEREKVRGKNDLDEYLYQAARFIAGLPVHNDARTVFLAQLISSGLDADKLDYMSREEHFSGIKIEMDLERLYNKIKLFYLPNESDLPKEFHKYSKHLVGPDAHKDFIVLGIEKGGQFAYEEFCVARLALYEKIYLHKKVRAAEAFLKKKLELFAKKNIEFQKVHNWLFLHESIIENEFAYVNEKAVKPRIGELEIDNIIKENKSIDFTEIENRYIPFRSFGFGPANAKTDNNISRDIEFGGIEQNHLQLDSVRFWDILNPNKKFRPNQESRIADFTKLIAEEAFKILKELKLTTIRKPHEVSVLLKEFELDTIDSKEEKIDKYETQVIEKILDSIIIDIPDYRRVQLKYETLNFEEASYQTIRWTIPIDQIARYYQLHRILAYAYTEHKYCPLVYLATERVVYLYLKSNKLVFDQSQIVPKDIFKITGIIKNYLVSNSKFYEEYEDILPLNTDLQTVSAKRKINDIMYNLNSLIYFDSKKLTYLDVEKFLKQFEKKLQLPALNLISNIKVIPNDELVSEIEKIIKKENPGDTENIYGILPLGSYMSSSSNMMKSYRQFLETHNISQLNFTEKEQFLKTKNIILVDDNINTGRQALNIVAKMLNSTKKLRENGMLIEAIHAQNGEGEKIVDQDIVNHLRKIPLKFIFITGYEDSGEILKKYLIDYCELPEANIEVIIKHKLFENDKFFSGGSIKQEDEGKPVTIFRQVKEHYKEKPSNITDLKIFLEKIGKEVVKTRSIYTVHNQDPSSHSLGYCNRESLIIFPSSVPTMTITALWCSGKYENGTKEWKPLIPRPLKYRPIN